MLPRVFIYSVLALLISCAATPDFNTAGVDNSLTPEQAISKQEISRGKKVIWGGTIIETRNLKQGTQIEMLAYPLSSSLRPQTNKAALGRFIIRHDDYLEPTNFTPGKSLSVLGQVTGTQEGRIGESKYTYVLIRALQIHLWSPEAKNQTFFHFGIGIEL